MGGNKKIVEDTLQEAPVPFFKINTLYEITINAADDIQNIRHKKGIYPMKELFNKYAKNIRVLNDTGIIYSLYPELSEPRHINKNSEGPRWHYHGTILFKTYLSIGMFLNIYYRDITRSYDVKISDYRKDYWPLYISKQKEFMIELCNYHAIPYELNNKSKLIKLTKI